MKSLRTFLLGFAMFSLCAPLAQAQDYYESDGGLYWGVRGGLSQVRNSVAADWYGIDAVYNDATPPELQWPGINSHHELRDLEMDYGYVIGASLGYTMVFPEGAADLRFEAEGIYRKNDDGQINSQWYATSDNPDSLSLGNESVPVYGSLEVRSAMFNVLVDFHTPTRFVPYLGVGAGISQLVAKGTIYDANRYTYDYIASGGFWIPSYPYIFDETIYALSWQAIAGVGYRLSPGAMLTLEFRYFRLATDRASDLFATWELGSVKFDDWSMGVRFTF
ncbi:MAG: porin family protein [Alphaproteobacteria bacterium]|nr:porin family protein [Alphaproteobacteria bacterium]